MKLEAREIGRFPPMSWCAVLRVGRRIVSLAHGAGVDIGPDFFFEGAWNGPFVEAGFPTSTMVVGSGGRLADDGIAFVTPSHPLERLHSLRSGDALIVSNSLPMLLVAASDEPDPAHQHYTRDCLSSLKGLRNAVTEIPTRTGRSVRLHYCTVVRVGPRLEIEEVQLPRESPFGSYEEYVSRMRAAIGAIAENASDERRIQRYEPMTTLSSGYDSPAVSVLARDVGCRRALTFRKARDNFRVDDDSGVEIAHHLGLDVEHFDREEYRARHDLPEAEFVATGNGGEDVIMCGFERVLEGKLLFTGFRGDTVWARSDEDPGPSRDFVQKDPSGASLGEFRRRVGFIHVPVPVLTFTQHPSIQAISNSTVMDPWSVGGTGAKGGLRARFDAARGLAGKGYDRPIARRLVEEAGVPRHLFGYRKAAITEPLGPDSRVEKFLSGESFADFRRFYRKLELPPEGWRAAARRRAISVAARANYILKRLGALTRLELPLIVPDEHLSRHRENDYLFHWGVERARTRYEAVRGPVEASGGW